jgi:hypothetical protein
MAAAKKSTAKKAASKKATAKKGTAKKSTAKKSTAKKSTAKKSTAKKGTAKKATAKKAAAKKSTASAGASGSKESVLVVSKLREAVRSHDIRMAGEFVEALNDQVHELISKAVNRARGNKRGTVRPDDL